MKAIDRISKARTGLIAVAPFYATLAMNMGAQECGDEITETMATDGESLFFNPVFVEKCSDPELRGVLAHEVLHVALLHHTRRGDRDPQEWNIAADYCVNALLIAEGWTLPDGALFDSKYAGMTAEQVYAARHAEKQGQEQQGATPGQFGDVLDAAPSHDPAAMQAAEAKAKASVINAATIAASRGGMGSDTGKRLADAIRKPRIDPWDVLRRFIDGGTRRDYSWSRPNRRHVANGLYLPGSVPDGVNKLTVIIDTSGSVSDDMLAEFLGHIEAACAVASPDAIDVIQCDRMVQKVETFNAGESITIKLEGGGGTDMRPAFDRIDADSSAVIVLTDCEWSSLRDPQDPGIPVLWAKWGGGGRVQAFGETIEI